MLKFIAMSAEQGDINEAIRWYRKQVGPNRGNRRGVFTPEVGINSPANKVRALDTVCGGCPNLIVRSERTNGSEHTFIIGCTAGLKPLVVTIDTPLGQEPACKITTSSKIEANPI